MKKIVTQRSLEERAQFFKKNLGKVSLGETGSNAPVVEEKKAVSVHEIVEAPAKVEEPKKEEEIELDDLAIAEQEEEEQGNEDEEEDEEEEDDDDDDDDEEEDDDDEEEDDDDDEFKLDL